MKKELIIQPYLKDMIYDENSWLIIACNTGDTPYINFYSPSQDPEKEFETLKDFAQYYIENELKTFDEAIIEYKENHATASCCKITEGGDYDEESRRSWKTLDADGQIIEILTNVKLEDIKQEVKKISEKLVILEKDSVENYKETQAEKKDPYGYRGLSQSDFF